jgi:hypothetical protein
LGIYALSRSENFLIGPRIILETPSDGQVFDSPEITIKGRASNISLFYLNGRKIFTDEQGRFEENLLLAKGYNIIELKAVDKFDRETKIIRELVLK